jgi:hypothetical protein
LPLIQLVDPEVIPGSPRRPLPPPSPLDGALTATPLPSPPPALLVRAALALRRALLALADRIVPPHVAIFERSTGVMQTTLLAAVARRGVADLLSAGPLDAATIVARTGGDADTMHRVLRALATIGIFELGADGRFANNRLSRALVGGRLERTREWVLYCGSQSNVAAWAEVERTLANGHDSFEQLFGMTLWDWFERHVDEREMFAQAMMGLTIAHAPLVASLYPFAEVASICDVGGGRGTLLSELLIRHRHLAATLCDSAGVLESARALLGQRGVLDRVSLAPGSFFDAVPSGSEAYLLKNILHDWDDARCHTILGNVRRAMSPGQRLLLVEQLVARNDTGGIGPLADVQMMVVCADGRERSVAELQALMAANGFEPARVFRHPLIGLVEGRAV